MDATRASGPCSGCPWVIDSDMRTRVRRWLTAAASLVSALACPLAASAQIDFRVYVALGDSLSAGMVSNALVETHQVNSFPAQIARQAGVQDFQQPLVSPPGIYTELALKRYYPFPYIIQPVSDEIGQPLNSSFVGPFNNLGVPGATVTDVIERTGSANGFFALVLRDIGPALNQAVNLRPTLVTLWIGSNDVLGAATTGRAVDGLTLTPAAEFRARFEQVLRTLKASGAQIVAANLPDVSSIPFVTTIKPYAVDPTTGDPILVDGAQVPLIGPTGTPLPSNAFVTLAATRLLANGDGIPSAAGGQGTPLPDEVVLDPNETAIIRERIAENNRAIAQACAAEGVPLVDLHAFTREVSTSGRAVGGVLLTNAFLSGGIYSYDGIHPTDLGYAMIANEWIKVLNANGASLPLVDLSPWLGRQAHGPGLKEESRTAYVPFVFSEEAYRRLLAIFGLIR
jgi:lysophospholipase L1-like esterase